MYDVFSMKDFKFPDGFLWGSGYSGHQTEGNNIYSDRWRMEETWEERSGLACDSYARYKEDISLVSSLGHGAFRTSVEWSRIEPEEGKFDAAAAKHYVSLFSGLKEKGIKTFVTMVHGSVPAWFADKGGFANTENLKYFERYLDYIVPKIAPFADFFNVLNEFNLEDIEVRLGSLKFHARGYHTIKKYTDAPASSAHALVQYMPYRPHDKFDKVMTEYCDLMDHEFFFHAVRTGEIVFPHRDAEIYPEIKGTADFWSVNTYTRSMIDARKRYLNGKRYDHKVLKLIPMDFYMEEFYPESVIANLSRLTDRPVYITENGCCCDDDDFRIVYLSLYLSALSEAVKMGVDVRGYLIWSLLDNYEWSSYKPKFGLCSVDRGTFKRTPKPSAYFYRDIIENNGFNQEILRKYLNKLPSVGLK